MVYMYTDKIYGNNIFMKVVHLVTSYILQQLLNKRKRGLPFTFKSFDRLKILKQKNFKP
jgi:hypothetical protein